MQTLTIMFSHQTMWYSLVSHHHLTNVPFLHVVLMSGVISLIMGPAGMNDGYHNVFTSNNVVFTCESSFNQCPLPACGVTCDSPFTL